MWVLELSERLRDGSEEHELGHVPINGVRVEIVIAATQLSSAPALGPSTLRGHVHWRFGLRSFFGVAMFDVEEGRLAGVIAGRIEVGAKDTV